MKQPGMVPRGTRLGTCEAKGRDVNGRSRTSAQEDDGMNTEFGEAATLTTIQAPTMTVGAIGNFAARICRDDVSVTAC
jgi:hypothetical protein